MKLVFTLYIGHLRKYDKGLKHKKLVNSEN